MNQLQNANLPDEIKILIQKRSSESLNEEEALLIGKGGFTPSEESILLDAIIALTLGKNVLLKGPTGSGKTKLAETLSNLFHQPMHSINCSIDMDAEALLGFKTIENQNGLTSIEFVSGPVVKAMKRGHLLYIDEINMAKPETLPILNGVLDYRRMITNPFTGEVIKANEGFGVIAAINEGYVGTVPLNEALKNRFIVIDVPYIQGEELKQVLQDQSKLTDQKLLTIFTKLSADLLALVHNGQVSEEAASIRALIDTCDLARFLPPRRAIERGIVDKLEDEREKAAIRNLAETLFE
ncbi:MULTISPECIES: AAA family ATPase [Metabacillus]|uniref:MoxR family ATPase n=1 Tax=Metabacillus rhizolycopersici TaxID=2875709 RepID=A0ABS7UMT1_9BACI|nr:MULTISPECIES: MoxR family ATPase [Metabacillus]MBZ5749245.1 MoxR family ATPase [Metabacillus rhizolycopersici]MCM3651984.1 MoxR family ATPase [Metabacillus litoralis]